MESPPGSPPNRPQAIVARKVDARNVGGHYVDSSLNITNVHSESPRDLRPYLLELEKHISSGAAHDSYERGGLDAPKCHPKTRAAVQGQIMGWIEDGDQDEAPTTVMWLSGPAGSGKTAIAGSIADACQEKGWLAGSFFFSAFSGPPDRRSKRCVIPTLTYHLIQQKTIPGLREMVLSAIADTPSVFNKRLREQMEILILQPLRSISAAVNRTPWPKVVIVDGLDECSADSEGTAGGPRSGRWSQEANQQELIAVLAHASNDPAFPFRIIIVSRPEPAIRNAISSSLVTVLRLFLDEKYDPDADIALFLSAKFTEIRRRFNIPANWPSQQDIDTLVEEASGQFIYAATVIRFIFIEAEAIPPQERLRRVIGWREHGSSKPLAALDSLYLGIIQTSPNPMLAAKWLLTVHMMRYQPESRLRYNGWFMSSLLESSPGEMDYLLGNLTSLVDLGPDLRSLSPSFNFYHKTLGDFLSDKERCAALFPALSSAPTLPRPGLLGHYLDNLKWIAANFVAERIYQVLKNHGPQGTTFTNPGGGGIAVFLERFCMLSSNNISPHLEYNATDVDWWWSCLPLHNLTSAEFAQAHEDTVDGMFARIHKDCLWYRCLPSCKVWRKGILQHCAGSGAWRVLPGAKPRFLGLGAVQSEYREGYLGSPAHRRFLVPFTSNPRVRL